MRKTKLPTSYKSKSNAKCINCKAILIHSYDYFNGVYKIQCQNCGSKRYEPKIRFEARFQQASEIK